MSRFPFLLALGRRAWPGRRRAPRAQAAPALRALVLGSAALLSACSLELPASGPESSLAEAGANLPGLEGGDPPPRPDASVEDGDQQDASSRPSLEAGADELADGGYDGPQACALDGRYALKVTLDVSWVGTEFLNVIPVINPGQGELSFVVLMELHEAAAGIDAHFRACSVSVPEFTSSIGERYQARFDDAIWDRPFMPVFSGVMQASCHLPGCGISGDPLVALIGAALSPPTAAWPSAPAGGSWPDHDGDGEPGIAGSMLGPDDGDYAYPPVDLIFGRRVRDVMLGLRAVVGVQGMLDSCDEVHGETPGSTIHTRAVGCLTATRPPRCSASELSFLNDNLPVWTVRQGRFRARRLAPGAECKDARQLFSQLFSQPAP